MLNIFIDGHGKWKNSYASLEVYLYRHIFLTVFFSAILRIIDELEKSDAPDKVNRHVASSICSQLTCGTAYLDSGPDCGIEPSTA